MQIEGNVYCFDFETDPFKHGRVPMPFCVGWTDGLDVETYWNSTDPNDVVEALLEGIEESPEGSIWYAHNGGKFDFHYLIPYIDESEFRCIGARVVEVTYKGRVLRDSYAMIPVPLAAYKKIDFDYDKMEPEVREDHKREILEYLEYDCIWLHEMVSTFIDEFGLSLTMASAALKQLKNFYEFERLTSENADADLRRFYYGGRVECFKKGVMEGNWKVYDVNSMYPSVMKNELHPISRGFNFVTGKASAKLIDRCDFARIVARSNGALPRRNPDRNDALEFPTGTYEFFATGHEIRAGLETGQLEILDTKAAYRAEKHTTFAAFIDHFYEKRQEAKREGSKLYDLFYKLVMNSSYGKFAQNPDKFRDFMLVHNLALDTSEGWLLEHEFADHETFIYSRPTQRPVHSARVNIMTAASITGAARAQLFRGLQQSVNPVYCDTDSIICEGFHGDKDAKRLGAWDCEAEGTTMAIAGKKLYALFDENGDEIKKACKGVRISSMDIKSVAEGASVRYKNDAPTFSIKRETTFVQREVKAT